MKKLSTLLSDEERLRIDNLFGISRNRNSTNGFLSEIMKIIRRKRPLVGKDLPFTITPLSDGFVQVWIQTPPCRYSQMGRCTICNYWKGNRIPNVLDELLQKCTVPDDCDTLLINTCGGCLDSYELPKEEQEKLFDWINKQKCHSVIFETYADTLTPVVIGHIRDSIPNKEIYFEFGMESVSEDVLRYCLNKHLPKLPVEQIADNVHNIGGKLIANVVLGVPFLNQREQVEDAVVSIQTLIKNNIDYITLFPINVKPYTLTEIMYKNGLYDLVTGNMIIDVLSEIPTQNLPRINISWYGERTETGLVTPYYCPKCQRRLVQLFYDFNSAVSMDDRKIFFDKMIGEKCVCQQRKNTFEDMSFSKRLEYGYQKIKELVCEEESN